MNRLKRGVEFLASLIGLWTVAATWASAAPAVVRAIPQDGFARIEIEWTETAPLPVVSIENGVLVAAFDRPLETDIAELASEAPDYLAAVRLDSDQRTLRAALRGEFRLHLSQSYNVTALDLVTAARSDDPDDVVSARERFERERQTALDEARAEAERVEAEERARRIAEETIPPLPLRMIVSENDDFSRLMFEWTDPVAYEIEQTPRGVNIIFDRPAVVNLTRLRTDPPKFIFTAEQDVEGERTTIRLETEEGSGARHYREGAGIVLDITSEGEINAGRFEPPADYVPPPEPEPIAAPPTPVASAEPEEAGPPRILFQGPVAAETGILRVEAAPAPNSLRLLFPWGEAVPAAFFRRGHHLWAVFDSDAQVDFSVFDRNFRQYVQSAEQVPNADGATVLRMRLANFPLLSASAIEGGWALTVGSAIIEPTTPITLQHDLKEQVTPRVRIGLEGAAKIHWLHDPEIGDKFAVVTAGGPPRGVVSARNFVEFIAHATAHGLMIQPLTDELKIERHPEAVAVFGLSGLSLSSDLPPSLNFRSAASVSATPGVIDFEAWKLGDDASFIAMEQRLSSVVAERMREAAAADRKVARANDAPVFEREAKDAALLGASSALRQALYSRSRFYLAHELAAEALATLKLIAEENEIEASRPEFLALRGAANQMLGRYTEASEDWRTGAFDHDASAALWRGLAAAGAGEWIPARRHFVKGDDAFSIYPPKWRATFRLAAADAGVMTKDIASAQDHLSKLQTGNLSDEQIAHKNRLNADILRLMGRKNDALDLYARVIASNEEPYASWATYRETILMRETGRINGQEAMDRLAAQQFRWRGDDLELRVLHELGRLYVEKGEYREGLSTMRGVVTNFPDSEVSVDIAEDMKRIFEELYNAGKADELDPVHALALFYENIDLIPVSSDGDVMIQRLAKRLESFDLLEQSAELLEHQVKTRLRGPERAEVASELALIYLKDKKPRDALTAIRSSRQARLSESLNQQRRLLEGRALFELGRYDQALELVSIDRGEAFDVLRADIHWRTEDWGRVGDTLEKVLGDVWQAEGPLSEVDRARVMRAAIGFSLAGDQISLDRLRTKFSGKLADSPDAKAFKVVAGGISSQGIEFRDLARKIASTDTLDAFIAEFKANADGAAQAGEAAAGG